MAPRKSPDAYVLPKLKAQTKEIAADGGLSQADAETLIVDGYAKGDMALMEKDRKALEALEKRGMLVRR